MDTSLLLSELRDGVLVLSLNRPQHLNALNSALLAEIDRQIGSAHDDKNVAGIILTGTGPKAFAAGADISEFADFSPEQGVELSKRGHEILNRIESGPKPVIAAVNGFALGGGCELAMACHVRLASQTARFGQPEVKLGIVPGYGGTQRLAELVGKGKALELLLTGSMISAEEAHRIGLVNEVVSPDALMDRAQAMMKEMISKGPMALAKCIALVNARYRTGQSIGEGYALEAKTFGKLMGSADFREGTRAFLEKREARFTGS